MATNTIMRQRVDIELKSLRLMLADLPEVAAAWGTLADGERVSWSLDWDQLMGALRVVLAPCYRSGQMTLDQQAQYRELLQTLKHALPLIERLNLSRPSVPLDA